MNIKNSTKMNTKKKMIRIAATVFMAIMLMSLYTVTSFAETSTVGSTGGVCLVDQETFNLTQYL